jgi:hypothetical protein
VTRWGRIRRAAQPDDRLGDLAFEAALALVIFLIGIVVSGMADGLIYVAGLLAGWTLAALDRWERA